MMLYPTVAQLTDDKINRYNLVIAAAKGARHIIDKANETYENEDGQVVTSPEEELLLSEKPVSIAVKKLYDGEFKIIKD